MVAIKKVELKSLIDSLSKNARQKAAWHALRKLFSLRRCLLQELQAGEKWLREGLTYAGNAAMVVLPKLHCQFNNNPDTNGNQAGCSNVSHHLHAPHESYRTNSIALLKFSLLSKV